MHLPKTYAEKPLFGLLRICERFGWRPDELERFLDLAGTRGDDWLAVLTTYDHIRQIQEERSRPVL